MRTRDHGCVREKKPTVTLRWIAREAAVSLATVSRALRRPDSVAPDTRDRILALFAKHSYVPDARAVTFSSRRTDLVGLIVPTLANSIYADFTEAIQKHLQSAGRKLLIANANYSAALEREIVHKLVESRVDGVIFTGFKRDAALYELLQHYGIPFVVTWAVSPDRDVPSIAFDNRRAASNAMEVLIDLGHRRIGLICGVSAVNDRAAARLAAYRQTLKRHRIAFDPDIVIEGSFEIAQGAAAARAMMGLFAPPTALFCANDIQALGALFACQRLGLEVPRDVSILGFDDLPIAQQVNPPLSTVHVPAKDMGMAAAAALIAAVDSGMPIRSILIQTSVVLRGSTSRIHKIV